MSSGILRSTVAVASGWIVAAGGYILTVVIFSLFNPETFTPGVPLPIGWLLVTLAVSAVWSVAAGFVAGVIARRREIERFVESRPAADAFTKPGASSRNSVGNLPGRGRRSPYLQSGR